MACVMLVAPAIRDAAFANSTLNVGYNLAFWAISFGHTNYEGILDANSYSAKAHFETGHVVSIFWKSKIDATVNGAINANSISPTLYDSYAQDRDKPMERVKVTFENSEPVTFADPPYDTTKYPVSEEQKKGAVDPMSALTSILAGVKADAKNLCGTGARVFDGRRRYDITFTYLKEEPVKLSNGLFNGNSHLCQIHMNQIAGYKPRLGIPTTPKMFGDFVDIPAANAPTGHYVVAVKLWAPITLGTVTVTLDTIKVDGMTPAVMGGKN
jgi:Protein of unknown function (DUF3108)